MPVRFKNKYSMTVEENIFYAKRVLVDSIYKASRLEGVAVTYPQTYELFEGRTVAGLSVDDVIKVNNLKHGWSFILDHVDYPMDLRFIRQINQNVGAGLVWEAGNLRQSNVGIGGTNWIPDIPDLQRCTNRIQEIMAGAGSETDKAIEVMLFVMRSQMFNDGNKRTAQLAANQILVGAGAGVLAVPVEEQKNFLEKLIVFYETEEADGLAQFVYERCVAGPDMLEKDRPHDWEGKTNEDPSEKKESVVGLLEQKKLEARDSKPPRDPNKDLSL